MTHYSPRPPRDIVPDWAVTISTAVLIGALVALLVLTSYFR